MCKKKHTRDKSKKSDSWSDEETVTLDECVTKAKSGKIPPSKTRQNPVDVNIIQENDKDGEAFISSRGNDQYRKNRRSRRDIKGSPKIRRRLLSKSLFRQGKRCPLSPCLGDKEKGDNKSVSSTKDSWSADSHKKTSRKIPKGRKILCGRKKDKHKERGDKSQSFREDPLGQKASLGGSKSDKTRASSSNETQKKVTGTSSHRVKVRQDQNLSPKILRAFSSESMLWSEASWNRPSIQSPKKVSGKSSDGVQKAALDKDYKPTEIAGLTQMYSGKENVPLTRLEPVTDEPKIIYTTPDRFTQLQGQVDQTRDILRPIIVNRARGLIDRAMDELHRSINLSAFTNQEFLKVGENSGNRSRRLWMTEFFSKMSTRRMKSSLPRLPSTQTLTPAVAAARESAFSLIAPSRNIRVRLMTDQVKSDTDLPIINGTENGNAVNSDVCKVIKVSELKVTIKHSTVKDANGECKKDGHSGSRKKLKYWWRCGQTGQDKDSQEDGVKKTTSGETRDQREPKNGCEKSRKKRLSWKTLRQVLRLTKSQSKTGANTDPSCHNKADDGKLRKEKDNRTAKKTKECSTKNDTKEDSDSRGKFSQTLAKAKKGWKKFNDWLDE